MTPCTVGPDTARRIGDVPLSRGRVLLAGVGLALAVFLFAGLGTWQLQRLAWKRDLIDRVEARIHATPAPAPARADWGTVDAASSAYRRVSVTGAWMPNATTLVQAVTEYGGGYWVLTPLRTSAGGTVFVNRGFVPADRRDPAAWRVLSTEATVAGLLRMSEPGGAFLRANDPEAKRWTSRDTVAMAAASGLGNAAPFFIDAEKASGETGLPIAGLTVVAFSNNHLVYAVTWYGMALVLICFGFYAARTQR